MKDSISCLSLIEVGMYHPDPVMLPKQQSSGASGFDLCIWGDFDAFVVRSGETALVPTGLRLSMPVGVEAQIRMRSGLALSGDCFIPNSPSTIDSDYRGEVFVMISALRDCFFERGQRIAQLVFCPVLVPGSRLLRLSVNTVSKDQLGATDRGEGGFGSTGSK